MHIEAVLAKLASLSGEFLFVIAAFYVALLCLERRRWVGATIATAAALLWLTFHLQVSLYLESLGSDSFAETRNIDFDEARFWFGTLREAITPEFSFKKFAGYLAFAVASFYLLRYLLRSKAGMSARGHALTKALVSMAMVVGAFYVTTATAVASYAENTELFDITVRNFKTPAPEVASNGSRANLVVYVGESTSTMNMGLYGYPRATTPQLSQLAHSDENLIVFQNVFATHAHTSRSLLEALSLGTDARQEFLPIAKRRRVPLPDVLGKAGVDVRLASNQGMGGSWDHASSVIFRNAVGTFRVKAHPSGAADEGRDSLRWDDNFFHEQLGKALDGKGRKAVFLHSYAGHGVYLENIPQPFRRPVDDRLQQAGADGVTDAPGVPVALIDDYDSAIRYVDHSLARTIAQVRQLSQPTILVYFSDHGDAVFAGRGHDSARFKHEMLRVPFIVYFNPAARAADPALFSRYRQLAQGREVATLAQLPSTLLSLMGLSIREGGPPAVVPPVVGAKTVLPPLLIRESGKALSFLNLNEASAPAKSALGDALIDRNDEDTRTFVAVHAGKAAANALCAGDAKTFEALARRIMLAACAGPVPWERGGHAVADVAGAGGASGGEGQKIR